MIRPSRRLGAEGAQRPEGRRNGAAIFREPARSMTPAVGAFAMHLPTGQG